MIPPTTPQRAAREAEAHRAYGQPLGQLTDDQLDAVDFAVQAAALAAARTTGQAPGRSVALHDLSVRNPRPLRRPGRGPAPVPAQRGVGRTQL